MWWRHISGTTKNTVITILCTPLSFTLGTNLVTHAMQPPTKIYMTPIYFQLSHIFGFHCSFQANEKCNKPHGKRRCQNVDIMKIDTQIKMTILKRREESDTYLTHVCRHYWSREILMEVDGIGATSAADESHSVG